MLPGFRPIHSSRLWRATYVVCALLVFSYILFDVLDLDGSNFPSVVAPEETTVIVAVVPSDTQLRDSPDATERWVNIPFVFTDRSEKYTWQHTNLLKFSPLGLARSHGYRVGLARDSLPDSSPYF